MWRNAIIHYEKSDDDIIFATTMRKLTTLIALLLLLPSINGSPVTSGEAEKVLRDLDREIKLFGRIVINLCLGVYFAYSEDEELGVVDSV